MRRILWSLLVVVPWSPAVEAARDWTGTIEVAETLTGPRTDGGDRQELDDYARQLDARTKQAKAELAQAPGAIARALKEDIGFFEAELERVVVARGGGFTVGRTVYAIDHERLGVSADGARLVIDRGRRLAAGFVDGQARNLELAPEPPPNRLEDAPEGPEVLGLATRTIATRIGGRAITVQLAPGLPNPYALGLLAERADDLATLLASLPGLPLVVEGRDGDLLRRLSVVRIEPGAVPDGAFTLQ